MNGFVRISRIIERDIHGTWPESSRNQVGIYDAGSHPVVSAGEPLALERPQSDALVLDRVDGKKRPSGAFIPKLPPKKKVSG